MPVSYHVVVLFAKVSLPHVASMRHIEIPHAHFIRLKPHFNRKKTHFSVIALHRAASQAIGQAQKQSMFPRTIEGGTGSAVSMMDREVYEETHIAGSATCISGGYCIEERISEKASLLSILTALREEGN